MDYAKKYFYYGKKEKDKKSHKKSIISYSKKLSQPLHNFESRDTQKSALEIFEKIQTFLDPPKRLGSPVERTLSGIEGTFSSIARSIKQFVDEIFPKKELRDEVYVQIIKQMTNNPNPESINRGWNLLCTLVNTFLPGKELLLCIIVWLLTNAVESPNPSWYCLKALQKAVTVSERITPPGLIEIEASKVIIFYYFYILFFCFLFNFFTNLLGKGIGLI